MYVEVNEYDPEWPKQYQQIKQELELALQEVPYLSIEHVGSTSVPGLAAKPTIDIDIIVTEAQLQPVIAAVTKDDTYSFQGDQGIPHRYAIRANDSELRPKRNIYICIDGCQSLRNHLAVRDACRANNEISDRYGQFKRELSRREWENVDEYCQAKTEVLISILSQAEFGKEELEKIAIVNGITA